MTTLIIYAVVMIYAVLFVWQCCKYQFYGWLAAALTIWVIFAAMSSVVLPGIAGLFKPLNLFLMPVYVLLGSVFMLHQRNRLQSNGYLSNLLYSSWLQFGALAICLTLILCLIKNTILLVPLVVSVLQMLTWQPLYWIGTQWLLMLMLFSRTENKEKSVWRMQTLLLFCLFTQLIYLMLSFRGKL